MVSLLATCSKKGVGRNRDLQVSPPFANAMVARHDGILQHLRTLQCLEYNNCGINAESLIHKNSEDVINVAGYLSRSNSYM